MRASLRDAVRSGLPTVAECGGFMALCDCIGGYGMAGAIPTRCHNTGKLSRFGYVTLTSGEESMLFRAGDGIRAHEFHYWDADDPGAALTARKRGGREWTCGWTGENLYAGFPHLYLYSNVEAARRFVRKCIERRMQNEADGN